LRIAVTLVSLAVAAGLIGAGLALRSALEPVGPDEREQVFVVEGGATLSEVADALEGAGLVRRAWAFEGLARFEEAGADLRAGEYALSPHMRPAEILDRLTRGQVRTHPVSIPEGLTAVQVASRVEEAGFGSAPEFLALARDPAFVQELGLEGETLEGYLFPETYRWARGVPTRELIADMVGQYQAVWSTLALRAEQRGLSRRDAVILASIVEKETGAPEERPLIAGVFLNRLARGMRLETDPSVIYGIADFDGNLRRVHLEDETNPYNTYRIPALPPGPIANPGAEALRAVVDPAETKALFFVSKNDGTHHFSKTYAEHARAVDRYQRGRNRRNP
jgi:UPF0755 protein